MSYFDPFYESFRRHFGFLETEHLMRSFHPNGREWWIAFENDVCRVDVVIDRRPAFVTVSSREPDPAQQTKVNMLRMGKRFKPGFEDLYPPITEYDRDRWGPVDAQLAASAAVVREYCQDALRGDFDAVIRSYADGYVLSRNDRAIPPVTPPPAG